ncbi:SPOR domain-containing protein [Ascidiaceihabitans sp.]|uniref:SPOR domain-containing protein n=1 Tax=Ascidiaceihabitans sp. TaxID=1872644 RepID=UPI0032990430
MKLTRIIATTAIVAAMMAQAGHSQSLRNADEPAEFPPASYKGTQYVDSRGCVYIRAGISGNVSWVPRVSRDRKQLCGQNPTSVRRTAAASAPAVKPPVQITLDPPKTQAAAPAPALKKPVPKKTARVQAPAKTVKVARVKKRVKTTAPKPVVRRVQQRAPVVVAQVAPPKPVVAPKPAPVRRTVPAAVQRGGNCGVTSLSRKYINSSSKLPVRCGPQAGRIVGVQGGQTAATVVTRRAGVVSQPAQPRRITSVPQGIATGGTVNSGTRIVPRHVHVQRQNTQKTSVPNGYRTVWEDDRLNPKRAEQSVGGVLATNYLWTNTVPRRLINANTRRDVTGSVPLIYPYTDMATQQRELGTVSIVRRDGQVLKRIVRNKQSSRSPIARQPVVSTRSAPVAKPKAAPQAGRYVQVGTFGQAGNAQATAQRLKAMGLPVRVGKFTRGSKTYRLVLAGPFSRDASRALAQVRRAGYSDAFLRK